MTGLMKFSGMMPLLFSSAIPVLLMGVQIYLWTRRKKVNLALLIFAFALFPFLYSLHLTGSNTIAAYEALGNSSPENMAAVFSHGKGLAYLYVSVGTWLSGILLIATGIFFTVALPLITKRGGMSHG